MWFWYFAWFGTICTIKKTLKNTSGGVLLLVKSRLKPATLPRKASHIPKNIYYVLLYLYHCYKYVAKIHENKCIHQLISVTPIISTSTNKTVMFYPLSVVAEMFIMCRFEPPPSIDNLAYMVIALLCIFSQPTPLIFDIFWTTLPQ